VKINRDLFKQLNWKGDADGPWVVVSSEIVDTWRWGNVKEVVLRHNDGTHWSQTYQVGTPDKYYNSLDDEGEEIELVQVWPHQIVTTVYKETPPDGSA
jgi:hypothetical protein